MALSGRAVRISRNGVVIAGAKTDAITVNNDPLDITDKDDLGWRTMLADTGMRTISLDVEGVLKSDQLIDGAVNADASLLLAGAAVNIEGFGTLEGDFFLKSIQLGAEQKDVVTFKATLESSGSCGFGSLPNNLTPPYITQEIASPTPLLLTADRGTWGGELPALVTDWYIGDTADTNPAAWTLLELDAGTSWLMTSEQVGKYFRVKVTATNSVGSTVIWSAPFLSTAP